MDEKLVNVYPYNKILDEEIAEIKTLNKLTNLLFENSRLRYFRTYFYRTDDPRFEFNEKDVLLNKITVSNSIRMFYIIGGFVFVFLLLYILWYHYNGKI